MDDSQEFIQQCGGPEEKASESFDPNKLQELFSVWGENVSSVQAWENMVKYAAYGCFLNRVTLSLPDPDAEIWSKKVSKEENEPLLWGQKFMKDARKEFLRLSELTQEPVSSTLSVGEAREALIDVFVGGSEKPDEPPFQN